MEGLLCKTAGKVLLLMIMKDKIAILIAVLVCWAIAYVGEGIIELIMR
jgi:hypothetical protein